MKLLEAVVLTNVVGIRADLKVPKKFLGYFRYRWGFLILTGARLPTSLIRFLISQWITNFSSCWLEKQVRFRYYLKHLPEAVLHCEGKLRDRPEAMPLDDQCPLGSPVPALSEEDTEYNSDTVWTAGEGEESLSERSEEDHSFRNRLLQLYPDLF